MTVNEGLERLDRIAVRAFLDDVVSRLHSYGGEEGSIGYPGSQQEVDETDWDGSTDSVRFWIVTASEFKRWLAELAPARGAIHISPKGSTHKTATGWYAECDDCGIIAEGFMTPEDHDKVVRAWFAHDKDKHGGDGVIPYHMLIVRDKR